MIFYLLFAILLINIDIARAEPASIGLNCELAPLNDVAHFADYDGPTAAFFRQIPYQQGYSRLQNTHLNREDYLAYFEHLALNQKVIRDVLCRETVEHQSQYILYRGMIKRWPFNLLLTFLNEKRTGERMPEDFILFGDPWAPTYQKDTVSLVKNALVELTLEEQRMAIGAFGVSTDNLSDAEIGHIWAKLAIGIDPQWLSNKEREVLQSIAHPSLLMYLPYLDGGEDFEGNYLERRGVKKQVERYVSRLSQEESGRNLLKKLKQYMGTIDHDLVGDGDITAPLLLSTNLSLFGNCFPTETDIDYFHLDECTLFYWLNHSIPSNTGDDLGLYLRTLVERYGLGKTEEEIQARTAELLQMAAQDLRPEDSKLLFQITIPKIEKDLVNRIVFISYAYGRTVNHFGKTLTAADVLELYSDHPEDLAFFFTLQGRIIVSRDGILDPRSGIRMHLFRPQSASSERIQAYEKHLRGWVEQHWKPQS